MQSLLLILIHSKVQRQAARVDEEVLQWKRRGGGYGVWELIKGTGALGGRGLELRRKEWAGDSKEAPAPTLTPLRIRKKAA